MFPFDLEDDELDLEVEEEKEPSDYEIDFDTGKLTGRIVTGLDAIKQWVKISLSTDRYRYTQYSWNHGHDLSELIGHKYSQEYVETEARRMIEECIMVDGHITGIDELKIYVDKDTIRGSFKLITTYGETEVEIDV